MPRAMKSSSFFCTVFILFTIHLSLFTVSAAVAVDKWSGVDEAVVQKYAKEHGRESSGPLINTDKGDLPLFLFLIAGTVGGFAAGYYWKTLMYQKKTNNRPDVREEK